MRRTTGVVGGAVPGGKAEKNADRASSRKWKAISIVAITDTTGFATVSARSATVVTACRMVPCELQSCIGTMLTCESADSGAASSHVCPSVWCTATARVDAAQRTAQKVASIGNPASAINITPAIRCRQLTDRVYRELLSRPLGRT
jgi:hypothetical protein